MRGASRGLWEPGGVSVGRAGSLGACEEEGEGMRVVFGGLVIDSIEKGVSCGGEGLEDIVIVFGSLRVSASTGDGIGELEFALSVCGSVEQVG